MADKTTPTRSSISMHEGVAVWCDCCSCEIEPYWQAVADELGIDLGSDYESNNVPDKPESIPGDSGS